MKKSIISLSLVFVLLFLFIGSALSTENKSVPPADISPMDFSNYPIVTDEDYYPDGYIGYVYPIRPGMIEWTEIISGTDMARATQIPEDVLAKMSTDALLQTVLAHPLMGDIYLVDSVEKGFEAMSSVFNGLDELLKRSELTDCIMQAYNGVMETKQEALTLLKTLSATKSMNKSDISKYYGASRTVMRGSVAEDLLILQTNLSEAMISEIQRVSGRIYDIVYTPKGTSVLVYSDTPDMDDDLRDFIRNDVRIKFPLAVEDGKPTIFYNCHSYAWFWSNKLNPYWMDNPEAYWFDGSYSSHTDKRNALVNDKTVYRDNGSVKHSAIIKSIKVDGLHRIFTVQSKWGEGGLYTHPELHCPPIYGTSIIAYKKN